MPVALYNICLGFCARVVGIRHEELPAVMTLVFEFDLVMMVRCDGTYTGTMVRCVEQRKHRELDKLE